MAKGRARPNEDGRRIPRAGWALVLVLAAVIGSAVGIGLARNSPSVAAPADLQAQVTWAPGTKAASDFAFKDQNGRLVSLRSVRGRPVLLTFLDSRCKAQCPLEGRVLGEGGRRLARPSRPVLMVVSIDPWADTAATARAFTAESRWSGPWHWLFGTKVTLPAARRGGRRGGQAACGGPTCSRPRRRPGPGTRGRSPRAPERTSPWTCRACRCWRSSW